MTSEKHTETKKWWALYWALKGFHVFPCNGKIPLIKGWPELATTNTHDIERWWNIWPDANIGCHPDRSGHFVVDIDSKKGKPGYETWTALQLEHNFVSGAMEVATPSGGKHVWLHGHGPSTVERLGPGIDTRGRDGFVLMGGSTLDGRDYQASPLEPGLCPVPEWLLGKLNTGETERADRALGDIELDLPHNIERAQRFLETAKPAIEGQGGNALTYNTACWLKDFGISENYAVDMMLDWNERCEPPWQGDELVDIIHNAYEFGRNEPGSKAIPDPNNLYGDVITDVSTSMGGNGSIDKRESGYKFKRRNESEQGERQPPSWLVEGLIPEGGQCLLYGAPGSYKSFIALDIALSVASGQAAFGLATKPGEVLYVAGEGSIGIEKVRRPAWKLAKGIEEKLPFYVVDAMPFAGNPGDTDLFIRDMRAQGASPKLIIVDTLARMAAGMDENSAKDMGVLLMQATKVQRAFGATLVFVHHSGKNDDRGARGSSALQAGFDTVIAVKAKPETKIVTLWTDKQKDAEPSPGISLRGKDFMGSLVFEVLAKTEAHALSISADALRGEEVHAALKVLGAIGLGQSKKTRVLAVQILTSRGHNQIEDGYSKRLEACEKSLRRLGAVGGRLGGFNTDMDGTKAWHLPPE